MEFLAPDPLADGQEPEDRLVQCGLSWERYLAFDQALGDDRPGPRFCYLDGDLEIITTSQEHERIKKWLAGFIADDFFEAGVEITPRGQATMRLALHRAGAEPDESWCIGDAKEFPDLVGEGAEIVTVVAYGRPLPVERIDVLKAEALKTFGDRPMPRYGKAIDVESVEIVSDPIVDHSSANAPSTETS